MPNQLLMLVTPKASGRKDGYDDDMMADSVTPPCPRCLKADDVLAIDMHPDLGTDAGHCCTKCQYAWPGDASTPQEQPPRPDYVASVNGRIRASVRARKTGMRI